jgi:hypothetical protein
MTETLIYLFGWVLLFLIIVAIVLRFGGRGDERSRKTRDDND